ncbi:F0F1 ATP synthase subunit B [Cyclobacterium xiamenense]|uniref:F0F1 ATP synthase subunit B family protein n=1 Tax=Cyclobacterium xiamenense TaxID=1297121 RepID=UPI0035D0A270
MEVNWFTVVAQIINFFILVWLLKRFLYRPILNAIDEREGKIAAQLKDAEMKKTEAKKEQEDFQQKNVTFDLEKRERTDKMILETKEERQKLLDQARKDAKALAKQLEKSAREKQLDQQLELNKKIREEVFAVSRKALSDLASVSFEEQLIQVFIKRLKALKEKELKQLKAAFKDTSDAMFVRSAVALPKKQQYELKKAIDTILDADTALIFEESPALIGGIELSTKEYKLAWSISEYLSAFENEVAK